MRPLSRNGVVALTSTNPHDQPFINLNFFSHDLDLIALREGVRMIDDIVMTGAGMKDIIEGDYPWPMPRNSDEAMIKQILERSQTGFHPCGTLRLGKNIEQGVVDPQLRVYGTTGLRVIDASVFPVIPVSSPLPEGHFGVLKIFRTAVSRTTCTWLLRRVRITSRRRIPSSSSRLARVSMRYRWCGRLGANGDMEALGVVDIAKFVH